MRRDSVHRAFFEMTFAPSVHLTIHVLGSSLFRRSPSIAVNGGTRHSAPPTVPRARDAR